MKRKHPNATTLFLISRPHSSRIHFHHPHQLNTPGLLIRNLPWRNYNAQRAQYVATRSLLPSLSWTAYYNFTTPLKIPLLYDNNFCDFIIHQLTTALHENQFTTIGLCETLNRLVAHKDYPLSINHYGHTVNRYGSVPYDNDPNITHKLKSD